MRGTASLASRLEGWRLMVAISTLTSIAISIALSVALTVVKMLLAPSPPQRQQAQQAQRATSADGKYNLKQNVPSLPFVYGRVKKGGDYVFLEEIDGTAYHATVFAAHRIESFVQHYLHDEAVTLNAADLVVTPEHFKQKVGITVQLGLDVESGSAGLAALFPTIWSIDHRGDGLAKVYMAVNTVSQESYMNVFPQQMPAHTAVLDGAWLYDPREVSHDPDDPSTWTYSQNLALIRLDHLTKPFGGKMTFDDMYLPEWEEAADVCDEPVTNLSAATEPRYHGGLWGRYENDPVEIGRIIDQAAELVIYERADGKIGVHAGQMVTPDIRIVESDIKEIRYDVNRRMASTVLAVRGRWTDPVAIYNTVDAAIYGDPYAGDDDTQRTKTIDNRAVQSHNHAQRLQKLAFTRSNAARVKLTVDYDAESNIRNIPYRRFIRVHYPARGLDEAIVELMERPRLDLQDLTISFDGIVVPSTLYNFNAATEEGEQGGAIDNIVPSGVPEPENFAVAIGEETLSGGQSAAFALASWDYISDALTYEMEYQLSDESEVPRIATSRPGEVGLRTGYLQDGAEYRFRLRAVSNQATSDWTGYETATATADATAPGQPTNFTSSKVGSNVTLEWINPNSPNLYRTVLYRNGSNNFGTAVAIFTSYGGIAEPRSYADNALAAGSYWWWIRSFNASGVASTQVGPQTQTI